ncbi:1-(5-phosphoribosyl)-5-[(5-phosphoribosylamino)methylideneamino]imidazole-4-carboxamide isomerase [Methanotorris formicicus]|uniref:1-(5-phosphoribosyl)-5-[(5-phosphoribosylamino)methylideneamino] imidazole-4-carboxamide isomerase n=1 Tax=Methanotorris formicicus Mc-S-70 TaxID=647171 RepID=H1KYG5_9EURY|nr:1-(5-phosphoribosyl)-5-[(5-phosphoribosylamino)methylideneamino]imidazole-4-carboxamide isomerase [Methanotorris formicicus]EHP87080.1 phosphoribosylformimino-5-aminoimidazole carboxamide ribotide isomerase [Methanotorris formicicus Mc-S-70]
MNIIPAVDIKDQKCVQLIQGDPSKKHIELDNPVEVAKRWEEEGAKMLHLVDLDGAFEGKRKNREILKKIIEEVNIPVEIGGGIRTIEDAMELINIGAERIIIGTIAIQNPNFVEELSKRLDSKKIMVALDAKDGYVVIKGWKEKTKYTPVEIGKILQEKGAGSILFTNVNVEGLLKGIDVNPIKELVDSLDIPVVASGGVTSIDDLIKLKDCGVEGVVIGSALYKGLIDLKEAIKVVEGR